MRHDDTPARPHDRHADVGVRAVPIGGSVSQNPAIGLSRLYVRAGHDVLHLVVYDPPHVADGGVEGIMAQRFGTAKGTLGLKKLIQAGFLESCRLARLGVLVKVADHAHGGEWLSLSDWIKDMQAGYNPYAPTGGPFLYCAMHTYRPTFMNDPKWKVQRVPRSNGAIYLAFRLDSNKHRDFDREYEKQ
jgi:hypothetical protein